MDLISEVQYIKKKTIYRIINRKNNLHLTSGEVVVCAPFSLGKIDQFWVFDQIKSGSYQIVSLKVGHVLARRENIVLEKGDWSSGQFWKFERAEIANQNNYFWILGNDDENLYLFGSSASNRVSMTNMDRTLFVSNWILQQVNVQKQVSGCCVIKSQFSNFVIDVPEGSVKEGVAIIQYSFNGRGNQRWVLQKFGTVVIIRNLCSNMILAPSKGVKNGAKIIQCQFTNKTQEKWKVEIEGDKYLFRNNADLSLYLGVSSNKESANLNLTSDKQKASWIIQGSSLQSKT